jgi:hypothetical protein
VLRSFKVVSLVLASWLGVGHVGICPFSIRIVLGGIVLSRSVDCINRFLTDSGTIIVVGASRGVLSVPVAAPLKLTRATSDELPEPDALLLLAIPC